MKQYIHSTKQNIYNAWKWPVHAKKNTYTMYACILSAILSTCILINQPLLAYISLKPNKNETWVYNKYMLISTSLVIMKS